ncbi:ABC transporter ATP-binding protein [Paractinoplanes globisporus]|uniref:ABC transporter ATP-binding protein n=1 Tax=Paractinoplanes globisporus TaxID=113565 RepID=A0ABW6W8D6_9ACTN|nr:ABC transporter ATP-binding protein [Actinoplanes globisporus]
MLEISELTAAYGDLRVLWDVSLSVRTGTSTIVLGRNGAGKTSLLNAIAGLPPAAAAGRIVFDGEDITGEAPHRRIRRGIGYVQENKQIFRQRTVEENLLIGSVTLAGWRRGTPARRAALDRAYARFPVLAERRKALAGGLSGGQQQMLAIAQALMSDPKLLILDEPSAGLAPTIVKDVFALIGELKREGLSILLVEQVVEAAITVADHIVVIDNGRVAAEGPVKQFDDASVIREIYLGRSGTPVAGA